MNRYLVPGAILDSQNLWLAQQTVADDILWRFGNDGDIVLLNRSTALAADAELTGVIEGTSDHQGVAANSLILSNITNDGDVIMLVSDGGNSKEYLRAVAASAVLDIGWGFAATNIYVSGVEHVEFTAGLTHFNQDSADIDLIMEGASDILLFDLDAGRDNVGISGRAEAGSLWQWNTGAPRSYVNRHGMVEVNSGSWADNAAGTTLAVVAAFAIKTPTFTATNAQIYTRLASLYIQAAPIDGSNVTATSALALYIEAGDFETAGGITLTGGRLEQSQGSDVESGDEIALGNGNYFDITGSTTINHITKTGWQAGAVLFLQFDASVTVTHNSASPTGSEASLLLAGAGDFSATAGDTLTLVYDGTTFRELARTVI